MNKKSFNKIIKTIQSCETKDQALNTVEWVIELRKFYNFSTKQNLILNDLWLESMQKITRKGL